MVETLKAPWLSSYGEVKFHIDYPEGSLAEVVLNTADKYPSQVALSCMGTHINYRKLKQKILETAKAYQSLGLKPGDKVTVCMPNLPQTVYSLYALNYIGVIASFIHPLSAVSEISFYLNEVGSKTVLTLDSFYNKFLEVQKLVKIDKIILTGAAEELGFVKKTAYKLIKGKKDRDFTTEDNVVFWEDFFKSVKKANPANPFFI